MSKKSDEKKELAELIEPKGLYPNKIIEEVKIQEVNYKNKKSFYIRIPMKIIDAMQIKKWDKFTFEVHLKKNPNDNKVYFRIGE